MKLLMESILLQNWRNHFYSPKIRFSNSRSCRWLQLCPKGRTPVWFNYTVLSVTASTGCSLCIDRKLTKTVLVLSVWVLNQVLWLVTEHPSWPHLQSLDNLLCAQKKPNILPSQWLAEYFTSPLSMLNTNLCAKAQCWAQNKFQDFVGHKHLSLWNTHTYTDIPIVDAQKCIQLFPKGKELPSSHDNKKSGRADTQYLSVTAEASVITVLMVHKQRSAFRIATSAGFWFLEKQKKRVL